MAWACNSFLGNTLTHNVLDELCSEDNYSPSMDYPKHQLISPTDQAIPKESNLQYFQSEENLFDNIISFEKIPIKNWNNNDTLNWATSVCKKNDIPLYGGVNVTDFQTVSGRELLGFSHQSFIHLVGPVYGPLFFREFQHFRLKEQRRHKKRDEYGLSPLNPEPDDTNLSEFSQSLETLQLPNEDLKDLEDSISLGDLIYASAVSDDEYLNGDFQRSQFQQELLGYEFSSTIHTQEPPYLSEQNQGSSWLYPGDLSEVHSLPSSVDQNEWYTSSCSVDQNEWYTSSCSVDQNQWSVDQSECSTLPYSVEQREQLSSPNPSMDSAERSIFESIPTNTKRGRTRGPKSWEFLLRLLSNPLSNPRLIEWVDREQGVFRLVDKDEIARLWGTREYKGREKQANLSYENFSRALRYYYPSKTLLPVMEKHLQYRFGPKVMKIINKSSRN